MASLIEYKDISSEIEMAHQEELARLNDDLLAKEVTLAEYRRMVQPRATITASPFF